MRILELAWEYPPNVVGGLGSHMAALVPMLHELGADVTVVTPRRMGGVSERPSRDSRPMPGRHGGPG